MAIKVNIIKTDKGYNFCNSDSGKLIGKIKESQKKSGVYLWDSYGVWGADSLNKCLNFLKVELMA